MKSSTGASRRERKVVDRDDARIPLYSLCRHHHDHRVLYLVSMSVLSQSCSPRWRVSRGAGIPGTVALQAQPGGVQLPHSRWRETCRRTWP